MVSRRGGVLGLHSWNCSCNQDINCRAVRMCFTNYLQGVESNLQKVSKKCLQMPKNVLWAVMQIFSFEITCYTEALQKIMFRGIVFSTVCLLRKQNLPLIKMLNIYKPIILQR
jgi:hypothetical protein